MERTRRGEAEVEREETRRILHGSLSKKAKTQIFGDTERRKLGGRMSGEGGVQEEARVGLDEQQK